MKDFTECLKCKKRFRITKTEHPPIVMLETEQEPDEFWKFWLCYPPEKPSPPNPKSTYLGMLETEKGGRDYFQKFFKVNFPRSIPPA